MGPVAGMRDLAPLLPAHGRGVSVLEIALPLGYLYLYNK
jgi:hypothetical protein